MQILKLNGLFLKEFLNTTKSCLISSVENFLLIIHPFWMNFEFLSAWWNDQAKMNQKKRNEALG